MKKVLCALSVVLALVLAESAARATVAYVPVLELRADDGSRIATQVSVDNYGEAQRTFALGRTAGAPGLRTATAALRTVEPASFETIADAATSSERGLLTLNLDAEMAASAVVQTTAPSGKIYMVGVPIIRDTNLLAAGQTATLSGFEYDVRTIAIANLGSAAMSCTMGFIDAQGAPTSSDFGVSVGSRSLRQFDDALGVASTRGTRGAALTCNQPFYALAALQDAATGEPFLVAAEPASGGYHLVTPLSCSDPNTPSVICYKVQGVFHTATSAVPKAIVHVPVTQQLRLSKVELDFDVTVGPWDRKRPDWAHNLIWSHRSDRFRSNTMFNVNAFGPRRNNFKFNQNFDMAPGTNRVAQQGYAFQLGQTYHINCTYDGPNRAVTVKLLQTGNLLRSLQVQGTAANKTLLFAAGQDVVGDFGNYKGQAGPEVASVGWSYANYIVQLTLKPTRR